MSRMLDDGLTFESNRTATDVYPNANSAGACWRIASAMSYWRIVTYTQAGETGSSSRAAGFCHVRNLPARRSWAASSVKLQYLRDASKLARLAISLNVGGRSALGAIQFADFCRVSGIILMT
jgi:hypothetical protein